MSRTHAQQMAAKPAVLRLDDGSEVELPDLTVAEALEMVRAARELGELVGGTIDPVRIEAVGG